MYIYAYIYTHTSPPSVSLVALAVEAAVNDDDDVYLKKL
jgi:hypothetical protein